MRTIVILVALSFLFSLSSCKKKAKETIEAPKTEITTTTVATPAPVVEVKEEPQPPVRQMNYFLVAGCFKVKSNADKLNARLINEGYDSKIIPFYNMHMVTYDGYETRREAQVALNKIVQQTGKELTWVYPVK